MIRRPRGSPPEYRIHPILSAGLLTGALCGAWTFVMGLTGWYRDPSLANMFFLVIAIEIAGLIWGLRRTAAQGRTYGGQILAGTMMAIVAGIIIVAASLLFTIVAFPQYFSEVQLMQRNVLLRAGKSEAEIATALQLASAGATPMAQAMTGFLGTLITGIVASALIALFVRAKPAAPPA